MKQILTIYMLLALGIVTQAAVIVTGFPPYASGPDSITMYREVANNNGGFAEKFIYKKIADTAYSVGPVRSTNVQNTTFGLGGLDPHTSYEIAIIIIDGSQTDTTAWFPVTTDTLPGTPGQFILTYTGTTVTPTQTKIRFHYSSSYNIGCKVYLDQYAFASPVLIVIGTGDTSIVAPVNTVGHTYVDNWLFGAPFVPVGGINPVYVSVPDYQVPTPTAPDVQSLTVLYQSTDSIAVKAIVKKGTTDTAHVTIKWSRGNVPFYSSGVTISSDTILVSGSGGLISNTDYTVRVVSANPGGVDSLSVIASTFQVPVPSIGNFDTLQATTNAAKLLASFATNGYSDSSYARAWIVWTDKFGANHTTDTSDWFIGPNVDTFMLTNLKDASTGNNYAQIYVRNRAGLTASMTAVFKIAGPKPAIPIDWGYLSGDVNRINFNNLSMSVPVDDMADVFAFIQPESSSQVDTAALYNDFIGSLSGSNVVSVGGLVGDQKYFIRIAVRNTDLKWYVNPTTKWEIPIPGIEPVQSLAPADISLNGTSITFTIKGSGNGTPTNWNGDIYAYGTTANPVAAFAEYAGTGTFSIMKTAAGMTPFTHYYLVSRITNPSTGLEYGQSIIYDFWTDAATGISEAESKMWTIDGTTTGRLYDLLGQQLGQGCYAQVVSDAVAGAYVFIPDSRTSGIKIIIQK